MDSAQERSGNNVLKKGSFESGNNVLKKGSSESGIETRSFWTVCPYCYYMYEYEKKYQDCCLLCQHCRRGFHGSAVAPPPENFFAEGKGAEQYYGYGFFPIGHFGNGFLGNKKEGFGGDNVKNYDVVDCSDDKKEEMNVREDVVEVKERVRKVKSVPRNAKKVTGRGKKPKVFEKLNESGFEDGCDEDELEFFEGEDDIFVCLKDF